MANDAQKVLIVEDKQSLAETLADKLKEDGIEAITANNGVDGLKKALAETPDLILLDLIMPKMDGLTVLKKLREDEWGATVPVIIFTNVNDQEKIAATMEAGMHNYIVKGDWRLEDIVQEIKNHLSGAA